MEYQETKMEENIQTLINTSHGIQKIFQEKQNMSQTIKKNLKYLEILERKIPKYLMNKKKIFLKNLIQINQKEMNSFMNKQKQMKDYFYQQWQQDNKK